MSGSTLYIPTLTVSFGTHSTGILRCLFLAIHLSSSHACQVLQQAMGKHVITTGKVSFCSTILKKEIAIKSMGLGERARKLPDRDRDSEETRDQR